MIPRQIGEPRAQDFDRFDARRYTPRNARLALRRLPDIDDLVDVIGNGGDVIQQVLRGQCGYYGLGDRWSSFDYYDWYTVGTHKVQARAQARIDRQWNQAQRRAQEQERYAWRVHRRRQARLVELLRSL